MKKQYMVLVLSEGVFQKMPSVPMMNGETTDTFGTLHEAEEFVEYCLHPGNHPLCVFTIVTRYSRSSESVTMPMPMVHSIFGVEAIADC